MQTHYIHLNIQVPVAALLCFWQFFLFSCRDVVSYQTVFFLMNEERLRNKTLNLVMIQRLLW